MRNVRLVRGVVVIRERLTGIGVLLIGILVFFVLIPYGIDQPDNVKHTALAPNFWPKIIAAVIALMGLLLAVKPGGNIGSETGSEDDPWAQRLPGLAVSLGSLFAFYFLIPSLGMVAPGAALVLGLMLFAGERRWWLAVAVSFGIPILLYVFFTFVAGIPIPLGVFESLRGAA